MMKLPTLLRERPANKMMSRTVHVLEQKIANESFWTQMAGIPGLETTQAWVWTRVADILEGEISSASFWEEMERRLSQEIAKGITKSAFEL